MDNILEDIVKELPVRPVETAPEVVQTQEQVTQPVETPTETPVTEIVAETKPVQKQWYEEETSAQPQNAPASPDPKLKEYEAIVNDPELQIVLAARKAGKTVADFVKEYQVDDVSKLTDEQLFKKGLKELYGIDDQEKIENEIRAFEEMSVFAKASTVEAIRSKFEQRNQSKLKELSAGYESQAQTSKLIEERLHSDFDAFSKEIVGKERFGFPVTEEISRQAKESILSGQFSQKLLNADGTYNVSKLFEFYLWDEFGKDIVKTNISKARSEGVAEVLETVTRPSQNIVQNAGAVNTNDISEALESFIESKIK